MSIRESTTVRARIDEYFKENPQDRMVFEEFIERANLSDGEVSVVCNAITRFFNFLPTIFYKDSSQDDRKMTNEDSKNHPGTLPKM